MTIQPITPEARQRVQALIHRPKTAEESAYFLADYIRALLEYEALVASLETVVDEDTMTYWLQLWTG